MTQIPAKRPLRIAIVGAGIGGLAAACALRQRGFEVEMHERSEELGEVGAGLQLGPNAFKVFRALGLEDELRQNAFEPIDMVSLTWDEAALRHRVPLKSVMAPTYGAA